jgi:type IV pilus assembly protein PilC
MPTFVFQAMDRQGKEVKDEITAATHEEAIHLIRKKGYYPTNVKQKSERRRGRAATTAVVKTKGKTLAFGRVGTKQLTQFTRQFSTLIDAGLPIVRSLKILQEQCKPGTLKNTLMDVTEDVQGGTSLSEAMGKHPRVYDRLYVNMVRAGEAGGVLDVILQRLADFMEKAQRLKRKVVGALIYPTAVISIALGILAFIMVFIIPKFQKMFDELGVELPIPTQILIAVSHFVTHQVVLLLAIPIGFLIFLKVAGRHPAGRLMIDKAKLKIPIMGEVILKASVSRFTRTLGTLISSGVAILEALSIVKGATGNSVIANAIGEVHNSIREGDTIAQPLRQSKCFDEIVVNMIEVGEETGELDKMMIKVADNYDEEVDATISGMMSLFEPFLIIFLGFSVGAIVISLFLPMIAMMDAF